MLKTLEILCRLKMLREERALLQEHVAKSLGIDRTTYVRKEKGLIPITTDEWLKIAKTMKTEPEFFFYACAAATKDRTASCDEQALLKLYRSLTPEERIEFISYINEAVKEIRSKAAHEAL
ncbi:MAG: hypothetical protein A3J24_06580 [Deltaproteobacteria bacterium RIFCSPLOWO2_02_FULL_53_8]|nr:MAG: hypothetical protein A3J24_06580 [Deltaproteobacteria bacterium RIFCSPLOWO2_02_FULL_53_8]